MTNTDDFAAILAKYSAPVPRYTSYPTAPQFVSGGGPALSKEMLAGLSPFEPISLYIHIPYCDRLCWFCGCHTKQTLQYAPIAKYIASLVEELRLVGERVGRQPLAQLHFGGGSPSILRPAEFERLAEALAATFTLDAETEISVEIDPSDCTGAQFSGFQRIGMTRASIGVQDFDPAVQKAINRPQSFADTRRVVDALRRIGVSSLNIDALYGLPLQTVDKLTRTIDQVVRLRPDRVALFGYAHVPWLKKHQRLIDERSLPGSLERFKQAAAAETALLEAGYEKIGIDHFALPGDSLAIAAKTGRLRRNFQGYTTDQCETLIGLGASAIGRFEGGYVQNIVATGQYQAAIAAGDTAADKGYRLTGDDRMRGYFIERLMCDFAVDFATLSARFGNAADPLIGEAQALAAGDADGLCAATAERFFIPEAARPFTRIVAARFDAYLQAKNFRYSKAV